MRKHTDEELIEELIRLKNQLGRNPLQTDFALHSKYSVNSYKRAFGGLSKALIKIGEKPNIKLDSSNYNILEEIKRVYDILKHPPDTNEFNKHSNISYAAVRRQLNNPSWHKLLIEAGVPIEDVAHTGKQNVTEEDLKNEVLRLKSILGRYPSYNEMSTMGLYSCNTFDQKYGTYIKTMHALGFTDYENKSFFHNQTYALGKDNVKYKSLFEAETANYLLKLVESNRIKKYEYERFVCADKKWTCDFCVKLNDGSEIWIEADGMAHNRREPYGLQNKKIRHYIDNGYRFFILKYRKNLKIQLDAIFEYLKPYTYDDIITVNNQLLTKKYISSLSEEEREKLSKDIFEYFRDVGFPYLDSKEEAVKEYSKLKIYIPDLDINFVNNNSFLGTYICKYYCRSFFAAKTKGDLNLLEVFYDDNLLKSVIKNRLSIGWTLKDGIHEFFNITPKMILQGIRSSRIGSCISMFKPSVAKYIYMKYSKEGDTVYDYSAGFGGRLLGAVSCNRKYIGIDPATSDSLNKMIDGLNLQDCLVMRGCSEDYKDSEDSIDLAFSSPPYFDQEIYTNDDKQAYNKGEEYFYDIYWNTTLINIKHMLKPGKYFILNVKNDKMVEMAKKHFQYNHAIDLKTVKAPMNKTNKRSATKNEGIYVFINNK